MSQDGKRIYNVGVSKGSSGGTAVRLGIGFRLK
jgi:hypothetical protein